VAVASFLIFCTLVAGCFLTVWPWTPFWEVNYFLQPYPALRWLVLSSFTRGAVSGLGIVNILLALHDAHQHRTDSGEGL
jgi:hypothetical protein